MRHSFVRSLAGQKDPNFKNVTLLLHGDGTNGGQNNTFLDSGPNNLTVTRNGNVPQGSFSPYGDRWSNYFDGTGDDLTLTGQNLSATDWTVECWVYFQSFSNNAPHLWNFGTDVNNRFNVWRNPTTGTFSFTRVNGGTYDIKNGTTSPVISRWYHVAVVRVNSTGVHTLYIDGVPEVTNTGSITSGTTWTIGFVPTGGLNDRMLGYISNLRVVTSAIYTTNFTPPTVPLAAIPNTSLLTCSTNRFRDASSNNRTISRNGDVSVQRFSPFGPDTLYRTDRIAGSAYFDGSGDDISFPISSSFELGGSDFTIEAWLYASWFGNGSTAFVLDSSFYPRVMWIYDNGAFWVYASVTGSGWAFTHNTGLVAGQWNHLVLQRNGNVFRTFRNGSLIATITSAITFPAQRSVGYVGRGDSAAQRWIGYIADMRIVKGTAVYNTSGFTPPTTPLTAIANTSLLLNFTNTSIVDNAMMNNLETVGNAQISTSVKKYGTGSLYFDGTGDWLSIPPTSEFEFGTGDFTVECWFYASTVSGGEIPVYKQHGAQQCEIRISSSKIYGKTALDQTVGAGITTLSINTWYHVAFVKASNTYTLYLNGVSEGGTVTNATTISRPTTVRVGANQTGAYLFNGYIDDLRITKGVARYTSNFTPPTAPFPDF